MKQKQLNKGDKEGKVERTRFHGRHLIRAPL